MHDTRTLEGINIVVTRPAHQASNLTSKVLTLGGQTILFPVLEISAIKDTAPLLQIIDRLEEFDLAVFVSPNAVKQAMHWINMKRTIPHNLTIAVVGKSSEEALNQHGVYNVIVPTGEYFDSEALLEHDALNNIAGKRIIIFRGNDGRKLLGETLIKRGAYVEYAQCYHRGKPDIDTTLALNLWRQNKRNALTITSSEGLHNLFDMVGQSNQDLVLETPLFTAHERIARLADDLGIKQVITSRKSGDDGLIDSLLDYFQTKSYCK